MKRIYLITTIIFGMLINIAAMDFNMDFHQKYREAKAMQLLKKRKYKNAYQSFEELASKASSANNKAKWTAYTAICLGRQKKKYDQAMKIAKAITVKPYSVFAQMELMTARRRFKDLIKAFKGEKISSWPEDIGDKGLVLRAAAYYSARNYELAIKDYEKSLILIKTDDLWRIQIFNKLGILYQKNKNNSKALENYEEALKLYIFSVPRPTLKSYFYELMRFLKKVSENKKIRIFSTLNHIH